MGDSHAARNEADKVYIGPNGSYLSEVSSNLTFYDPTVAATKTLTQLAASASITDLDTAFDGGNAIDNAQPDAAAGVQIGDGTNYLSIYEGGDTHSYLESSVGDIKFVSAGGDVTFDDDNLTTSGNIYLDSDSNKLYFGDGQDAYIYSDGSDLTFRDGTLGATVTLSQLANNALSSPTVTGDLTIADGKIVQTDTDDEIAHQITSSGTTVDVMKIIGNSVSSGAVIASHATDATLAGGGFYFRAYGGAANVFTVGRYGATVIAGTAAGTDALTLTAGDATLSSGDLAVSIGTITVADTADSANKISRNNAVGTNPVLEVEQTHASGGKAFVVDQNATGDVDAITIENAGTGYANTTTAGVAGSKGYEYIAAASGTGVAFRGDGSTGSWIGANDVGMVDIDTDGALAAGANLLRLDCTGTNAQNSFICEILSSGNIAGATDGICLNIVESGAAAATSFAVRIASTNNEGIHVDSGVSLFDETVTVSVADNAGIDALVVDQNDATQNKDGLVITTAGTGKSIKATTETATGTGSHFICAANQTTANLTIDGDTSGWLGADAVGMVHLTNDIAHGHANASMLLIDKSAAIAEVNDARGTCLRIVENMNVSGSPPAYAAYISSTNNEALYIPAGEVHIAEELHLNRAAAGAGYGHIKLGGTADHAGAAGENVITLFDGAAKPAGAVANGASLYSEAGELEGIDSGGNETTLTPHMADGRYIINSYSAVKGETLRVHVEMIFDWLTKKFPEIARYVEHINGKAVSRPLESASPVEVDV